MNLQQLTTGWTLIRIVRLVLAMIIAVQAVELREPLLGLISALFFYQAVANVACCGAACVAPPRKSVRQDISKTSYEEIKS